MEVLQGCVWLRIDLRYSLRHTLALRLTLSHIVRVAVR